jgi:hypothetical protein
MVVARQKPLFSKRHMAARLGFAKRHLKDSEHEKQDSPVWWNQDWTLWAECQASRLGTIRHLSTVRHEGGSIVQWGCFSAAWTGRRERERWTEQSTELLDAILLRTSDLGQGSPSNRTTTLTAKPRRRREWLRDKSQCPWETQLEPGLEPDRTSLAIPENGCAATLPIQTESLRGSAEKRGEAPQIQVCQACSVIP